MQPQVLNSASPLRTLDTALCCTGQLGHFSKFSALLLLRGCDAWVRCETVSACIALDRCNYSACGALLRQPAHPLHPLTVLPLCAKAEWERNLLHSIPCKLIDSHSCNNSSNLALRVRAGGEVAALRARERESADLAHVKYILQKRVGSACGTRVSLTPHACHRQCSIACTLSLMSAQLEDFKSVARS
jgi:hypothetical protein